MPDTTVNKYPVDSATRTCCSGIGGHTPECTGCRIAWCQSDHDYGAGARFEHYTMAKYIPVTGDSLFRIQDRDIFNEGTLALGVTIRWNEDTNPAPTIDLHLYGGPDELDTSYSLRIDEAVLFHRELTAAIEAAARGTNLDPGEIERFHSREDQ